MVCYAAFMLVWKSYLLQELVWKFKHWLWQPCYNALCSNFFGSVKCYLLSPFPDFCDFFLWQFSGKRALAKLLGNLLLVQEKLLEQNPDTESVLMPGTEAKQSSAHGSDNDDEEIPSDTEDEKSDDDDDVGENSKDENVDERVENSLKLPAKRKHEMVSFGLCTDISCFLCSSKGKTKETSDAG